VDKSKSIHKALIAEFIGSMFLVMASVSSIILFTMVLESHISVALFAHAVTVAFVLFALIEMLGPISYAHFNPVVTMAMVLDKKIDYRNAAMYIPVQIAGGISGVIVSHIMFFDEVGYLISIADVVRNDYKYFSEIIGAFILVLAILLLTKMKLTKASIIVSFLVGGQIMATSSMMFANPQVTIARMFTNTASGIRPFDGMVFIVMQIIGALLAFTVYKLIFFKGKEQ